MLKFITLFTLLLSASLNCADKALLKGLEGLSTRETSTSKPSYIFAHGHGGDENQAEAYLTNYNIEISFGLLPDAKTKSFNFSDAAGGKFELRKSALGQREDIETLAREYKSIYDPANKTVLFGVSRGASTILNFAGKSEYGHRIPSAIVAESPFAHIDDCIEGFSKKAPLLDILPMGLKRGVLEMIYPKYQHSGEQPINLVDKIDRNIPIALICSLTDNVVPHTSTEKIYAKLIEAGHRKTHILKLDCGDHADLIMDTRYRAFVHAFYANYGLPHNPDLAVRGVVKEFR